MDIHEYQAKALLKEYGVPIPFGGLAYSPEQAAFWAKEIGGPRRPMPPSSPATTCPREL